MAVLSAFAAEVVVLGAVAVADETEVHLYERLGAALSAFRESELLEPVAHGLFADAESVCELADVLDARSPGPLDLAFRYEHAGGELIAEDLGALEAPPDVEPEDAEEDLLLKPRDPEEVHAQLLGSIAMIERQRENLDDLEQSTVLEAKRQGMSWQRIGDAFDITRQGAYRKFSPKGKDWQVQHQQELRDKRHEGDGKDD